MLQFLACFQYAYVRALSGVCLSFLATTSHGVGRSCSFMARSIAYDPKTSVTEGFFFGDPRGRAWSPFSLVPQSRTFLSRVLFQSRIFSVAYLLSRVPGKKPFVTQNPTNPYTLKSLRDKSLTLLPLERYILHISWNKFRYSLLQMTKKKLRYK